MKLRFSAFCCGNVEFTIYYLHNNYGEFDGNNRVDPRCIVHKKYNKYNYKALSADIEKLVCDANRIVFKKNERCLPCKSANSEKMECKCDRKPLMEPKYRKK